LSRPLPDGEISFPAMEPAAATTLVPASLTIDGLIEAGEPRTIEVEEDWDLLEAGS
jgi:hypothetical protein